MLVAPYHIHRLDDEIFYILSGQAGFEVGNDTYSAGPGDAVTVPQGAIHTWWNDALVAARYLLVMPKELDDIIAAIHARYYEPDELSALYGGYDTTYIGCTR
jgi:uncharacterized cupin superfamily protein